MERSPTSCGVVAEEIQAMKVRLKEQQDELNEIRDRLTTLEATCLMSAQTTKQQSGPNNHRDEPVRQATVVETTQSPTAKFQPQRLNLTPGMGMSELRGVLTGLHCNIAPNILPREGEVHLFNIFNGLMSLVFCAHNPGFGNPECAARAILDQLDVRPHANDPTYLVVTVKSQYLHLLPPSDPCVIFMNGAIVFNSSVSSFPRLENCEPWDLSHCCLVGISGQLGDGCLEVYHDPREHDIACFTLLIGRGGVTRVCARPTDVRVFPMTMLPGTGENLTMQEAIEAIENPVVPGAVYDEITARGITDIDDLHKLCDVLELVSDVANREICSGSRRALANRRMAMIFPSPFTPHEEMEEVPLSPLHRFHRDELEDLRPEAIIFPEKLPKAMVHHRVLATSLLTGTIVGATIEPLHRLLGLATTLIVDYLTWRRREHGDRDSPIRANATEEMVMLPPFPAHSAWCLLPPEQRGSIGGQTTCSVELTLCGMHALVFGDDSLELAECLEKMRGVMARIQYNIVADESYYNYDHATESPELNEESQRLIAEVMVQVCNMEHVRDMQVVDGCNVGKSAALQHMMVNAGLIIYELITWIGIARRDGMGYRRVDMNKTSNNASSSYVTRQIIERSAWLFFSQYAEAAMPLISSLQEFDPSAPPSLPSDTNRTAICVTGAMRSADAAYPMNLPLLWSALPGDFFVVTPDDATAIKALLFRPTMLVLENDTRLDESGVASKFVYANLPDGLQRGMQPFYAMSRCWDMVNSFSKRTGLQYTRMMRYRPDIFYAFGVPVEMDANAVHTRKTVHDDADIGEERYMSDVFAYGTLPMMETLMSRMWRYCFKNVEPYRAASKNGSWLPETLLQACHDHFNVTVEKHADWNHWVYRSHGSCGTHGCW